MPKKTDESLFFAGAEVAPPPTSQIFNLFKKPPTEKKSEDKLELNEPLSNKKNKL